MSLWESAEGFDLLGQHSLLHGRRCKLWHDPESGGLLLGYYDPRSSSIYVFEDHDEARGFAGWLEAELASGPEDLDESIEGIVPVAGHRLSEDRDCELAYWPATGGIYLSCGRSARPAKVSSRLAGVCFFFKDVDEARGFARWLKALLAAGTVV